MSQPASQAQVSQGELFAGIAKLAPILHDAQRLNYIVYIENEADLQHLKVTDIKNGERLELKKWFKLRNYKMSNGSILLNKDALLNKAATKGAFAPSAEQLKKAEEMMQRYVSISLESAKSSQIGEYSRITVMGRIMSKGPIENRNRKSDGKPFSVQKYRIQDATATMQVSVFSRDDLFSPDQSYLIHNAMKRFFRNKAYLEVDKNSVVEDVELEGIDFCTDNSDHEGEADMKYAGTVTGILYGQTHLYDGCKGCKKNLFKVACGCNQGVRKSAAAKLEIEFEEEENGKKEMIFQVFTNELDRIQGKPCGDFDSPESFEAHMDLSLPCDIKFDISSENILSRCEVVKRWNVPTETQ